MWVLLLWKRYDLRDLFILNGDDHKPLVLPSVEDAESFCNLWLDAGYKSRVVRVY
jgi:hypothetical protein